MANFVEKWRLAVSFIAKGTGVLLIVALLYFIRRVYNSYTFTHLVYTNPDFDLRTMTDWTDADWMEGADDEIDDDTDTAELFLYFQNLMLELMKYRLVVTSWHFTILIGVWTIPQIQATIWLIRATSKNLSLKKEGKLMFKWGRVQIVYLIAELILIAGLRYYMKTAKNQAKDDGLEENGEIQDAVNVLEKHGKILMTILIGRMAILGAVLNYERIKVVYMPRPSFVNPDVPN